MSIFQVFIDDNFHYGDDSERMSGGEFRTLEEAVERCRAIVEESLSHLHEPGMTADQLLAQYALFGDDPFIIASLPDAPTAPLFSAREYAQTIAEKISRQTR